ncbi:PQQ-dependent sugar dehydrogenase [Mucilaginibacter myungsuensis]|uniref:PQQ-dependent sugar dehydrogenase n=1 Tax=Mucilaginibacter myungsuensis TaxID=649104 RepID=A0A929L426_9SPHI|nr:PQQ-dependent sugar dehydrogenase [Mucilaginibacter myungsuensis]MBE9663645.1 PQQ-dependent sugar dehydrogenase [Mucilaginibacter myungsuensis]MDN3599031.1 PQQ-dependent sugar dehydrogenase [Mucilaginibacter myungsuensis]
MMLTKKAIIRSTSALALTSAVLLYSFVLDVPKKPDESRFTPVSLTQPGELDEPNSFEVLKDGRVLLSERKGAVKLFDPITKMVKLVATIPVNTKYTSAKGTVTEAEEGLLGLTVDPDFDKNHFVYTFYSHATEKKFQLTRWKFEDEKLVAGSEKVMLSFPTQREICCHTGGGMVWDAKKNLYIAVGNNTGTAVSSSTDERPNRVSWDDQRGTANTNSLLGKILRIHPEANGTYTIPAGNLFPKGTALTRPEIYTMGHRNPWRPTIDSKTGWLYWGDIGPDATEDTDIGPKGYDELNQARKPGFYGWPYFVGPNVPFPIFDYVGGEMGDPKNPLKPTNTSVNNTGLKELPPVAKPFIWYPYTVSTDFPLVGSGSRCAVGGPIYHKADRPLAKRPWPAYYEGKWIATDLARGWIMSISMKPNGDYESMEQFLPSFHPIEPIDMKFGPDGDLYVLEYGSVWFGKSDNAKLVRIEYNAGNRKPIVAVATDKQGGTVPLKITLSSAGTYDADGDKLRYSWKVAAKGGAPKLYTTANPTIDIAKAGVYTATLTVTDPKGSSNSKSVQIIAGNEAPAINIALTGNNSFYFGKPVGYSVTVDDKEDGSLASGTIPANQIAISTNYVSEGFDLAELTQIQRSVDASTKFAVAQAIMAKSDCKNCHSVNTANIGPMFTEIAAKYKGNAAEIARLPKAIIEGENGRWGKPISMPSHPSIALADAKTIVDYIINVADNNITTLPANGNYKGEIPEGDNGKGAHVIRASYTDKGNKGIPQQTSEKTVVLRSPNVLAASAPILKGASVKVNGVDGSTNVVGKQNGYIAFKKLDLTGVQQLRFFAFATVLENNPGGKIEVRIDSPTGPLVGEVEIEQVDVKPKTVVYANTDVKDTAGQHDVYFVFKNDKAKPTDPLLLLNSVVFANDKK